MRVAPILTCADWRSLIAALAQAPAFEALDDARSETAAAVLAAPAAIARWIALKAPQLTEKPRLRLLVLGAESTDAVDQGRWYQAIPRLLGIDAALEVHLLGAELEANFSSSIAAHAPPLAAHTQRAALADFLAESGGERFDLAVLFQPGFQKHRGWLKEGGIANLLTAGTLLMGASYASDEYEMERFVLECHGFGASPTSMPNPFFLELGDAQSSIRWGSELWQIETPPPHGFRPDDARLLALENLNRMVLHSMSVVGAPSPLCGAMTELSATDGRRRALLHVFDLRFVDPDDGVLYRLDGDALQHCGVLPDAELARYPRDAASHLERALWAADIKSRFLLEGYPASAVAVDGMDRARGMFDTLRARAARLFR